MPPYPHIPQKTIDYSLFKRRMDGHERIGSAVQKIQIKNYVLEVLTMLHVWLTRKWGCEDGINKWWQKRSTSTTNISLTLPFAVHPSFGPECSQNHHVFFFLILSHFFVLFFDAGVWRIVSFFKFCRIFSSYFLMQGFGGSRQRI